MSDAGSAWKEAGERVAALGASLKRHYDERSGTGSGESAPDLGEAARRVADAVRDAVDSLGAAAQDPAVKEDARRVGTSFAEALSVTFAEVSDDLHRMATDQRPAAGAPAAGDGPSVGAEPPGPPDDEQPRVEPWGTP